MHFLAILLTFIEVVVCLMLIGLVLIQRSKGEGISSAFGGGMGESIFGANVGNVVTRTTVVLGDRLSAQYDLPHHFADQDPHTGNRFGDGRHGQAARQPRGSCAFGLRRGAFRAGNPRTRTCCADAGFVHARGARYACSARRTRGAVTGGTRGNLPEHRLASGGVFYTLETVSKTEPMLTCSGGLRIVTAGRFF